MLSYKIGEIAKLANINIETIRFYERKDLISPTKRLESGYRIFSEETLKRIKFIRHAKDLGFTLNEISELLHLQITDESTCHIVNQKAKDKIKRIQEKISLLTKMQDTLIDFSSSCDRKQITDECPILNMISSEDFYIGE